MPEHETPTPAQDAPQYDVELPQPQYPQAGGQPPYGYPPAAQKTFPTSMRQGHSGAVIAVVVIAVLSILVLVAVGLALAGGDDHPSHRGRWDDTPEETTTSKRTASEETEETAAGGTSSDTSATADDQKNQQDVPQAEPTEEWDTAPDVPISAGKFSLDGKEYALGKSTGKDFVDNGWTVSEYDREKAAQTDGVPTTNPDEGELLVLMEKPDKYDRTVSLFFASKDGKPTPYDKCVITNVIVDRLSSGEHLPELDVPGGIKLGMSKDEVLDIYGETDSAYADKISGTSYETLMYGETSDRRATNMTLTFYDGALTTIGYGIVDLAVD